MRTSLSVAVDLTSFVMMSLNNNDFFKLDQSDLNNPVFIHNVNGQDNVIPKKIYNFYTI